MNNFYPKTIINTGLPRHVGAHAISGALVAGVSVGSVEYARSKDTRSAIKSGTKSALQGALAMGAGIYATNTLGNPNASNINALVALGLATAGIYMIEKGSKNV